MKKNLFIAALGLVVLAGCSSEDEVSTLIANSDNAINFTTYVGKQTKAGTTLAGDFGVFAYQTTTDAAVAGGEVSTEKKVTVNLSTTAITAWETNKQYNYTIAPTLEKVSITATSDSWDAAATPNVPESK